MGLFGELQEKPGSLGPLEGGFHCKHLNHQVGNHHDVAFEEDVREDRWKAVEHRVVFQIFPDVQTPEKVGMPGRQVDPSANLRGIFPEVFSEDADLSLFRVEQVRDDGKKGRLPGSVGSQEAPERTLRHAQIHASQGLRCPLPEPTGHKGLLQSLKFNSEIQRGSFFL